MNKHKLITDLMTIFETHNLTFNDLDVCDDYIAIRANKNKIKK